MKNIITAIFTLFVAVPALAQTHIPRFEKPRPLQFVTSPVKFEVRVDTFGEFKFNLDLSQACQPPADCYATGQNVVLGSNVGHSHIYIENRDDPGVTQEFRALDSEDNLIKFEIALPRGRYCAWVDLTENDHRTIVKLDGPRAIPPVTSVCFRVLGTRHTIRKKLFGR